jgi:hypothetical protein
MFAYSKMLIKGLKKVWKYWFQWFVCAFAYISFDIFDTYANKFGVFTLPVLVDENFLEKLLDYVHFQLFVLPTEKSQLV